MKSIISKTMALLVMAAAILSFSAPAGGEGFEISLNGEVVLQRFGKDINTVTNLQVDQSSMNGQMGVKYYHCGKAGKNRIVSVRDWHNNILKEWRFADDAPHVAGMQFNVKDLFSLGKTGGSVLRLHYISSEMTQGRILANIIVGSSVKP